MSKLNTTYNQIDEMLVDVKKTLYQMTRGALASGALSEEMKEEDNWLLARAVIDIWCQARHYAPLHGKTKREFGNLSHFI